MTLDICYTGAVFSFIIVFSLVTNLLVLVILFSTPALQQSSNLFLASLSIADLFLTIFVMIPSAAAEIINSWPFGATFCQVYNSLDVSLCTISILHLSAISIDRHHAIVRSPLLYKVSSPEEVHS